MRHYSLSTGRLPPLHDRFVLSSQAALILKVSIMRRPALLSGHDRCQVPRIVGHRSFQGSAGSLLVTIQNLSAAIVTAIGDTIGKEVTQAGGDGYNLDLGALRAIWWFSLAISLAAAAVCAGFVRIPRSEEKDHVE